MRLAKKSLERFPSEVPLRSRVAVMIIFSRGFSAKSSMAGRLEYLRCALLKLKKHVMPHTTLDIFLWGLDTPESPLVVPEWFTERDFPRMHIMPLPSAVWRIPCGLKHNSQWSLREHFDLDYYLMGRWRLTFSLDFARAMGYEFHLQFDDDAFVNQDLKFNLTERMDANNISVSVFSDWLAEAPRVTVGLPELTSFWLRIRRYEPRGNIYKYTTPGNIFGLNSDGYYRWYRMGYFLLVRVSWYFSEHVQDYLDYVLRSGRDVEGRWQEQAVMNMMFHIFVAEREMWVIKELDIGHDRLSRANFENWCIRSGILQNK